MRKYQPIWETIKSSKSGTVSLAADPSSHARIIKAVRKEKCNDVGWKLLCSEQSKKYKIEEEIEGKLITFKLIDISHQLPISLSSL